MSLILNEEILTKYPKAVKEFAEYLKSKISEPVSDEDINNIAQSVILLDPRKLYDFFDSKNIIISITYHEDLKKFSCHNSVDKISSMTDSRIEAEKLIFENVMLCIENWMN